MRRTVAGAIDQRHDLAGVGQRDDERMVAPGAVVGDVDALFLLACGCDERAVGIEDGAFEEGGRLPTPHADADVVEDVLQDVDVGRAEASTEIASGGGVGDALSAEGVEEVDVVAAQFDVLNAVAVAEGVIGDIQYMIGFVIGEVNLEQMKALVDEVDQPDFLGEQVKGADAAVADAVHTLGDFVVDVAGGKDGTIAANGFGFVEATLDSALASAEPIS